MNSLSKTRSDQEKNIKKLKSPKPQRNRKIYVVSAGRHDISQAKEFGEVINLTEGTISLNIAQLAIAMSDKLQNFSEEDYILLTGNLAANFIVGMVLGQKDLPIVKVLIYNSKKFRYFEKTIRREDIW